jgi:LPXTG-site transpeptidase (sortase) family protein
VESSLEDGVVHYPTTVNPGQLGNTAFFGHSSNNIFNAGKYKFAFVLLHTLVPGDIFYLTYNDKVYAYQVYNREVVSPGDVSVLDNVPGKQATATLITCDPPGTSINRLVVWGTQISPSPNTDTAATTTAASQAPTQLANDGPTLWARFTHWVEHLF